MITILLKYLSILFNFWSTCDWTYHKFFAYVLIFNPLTSYACVARWCLLRFLNTFCLCTPVFLQLLCYLFFSSSLHSSNSTWSLVFLVYIFHTSLSPFLKTRCSSSVKAFVVHILRSYFFYLIQRIKSAWNLDHPILIGHPWVLWLQDGSACNLDPFTSDAVDEERWTSQLCWSYWLRFWETCIVLWGLW